MYVCLVFRLPRTSVSLYGGLTGSMSYPSNLFVPLNVNVTENKNKLWEAKQNFVAVQACVSESDVIYESTQASKQSHTHTHTL